MRWRAILLVVTLWAFGGAACGQGLRWDVTVGFDNAYKEGAWTPVFVDIRNEGGGQTGQIEIPVAYRAPAARKVNYAVAVDLPRHSKKRYTLYVPSEGLENVYLNLSGGRAKRELGRLKEASREDTLVVVVGGERGLLSFLAGTKAVRTERAEELSLIHISEPTRPY